MGLGGKLRRVLAPTLVSLLLLCCFVAASLLLRCCFVAASLLLRCCFVAASLLLRCCFVAASLLLEGPWLRTPSACPYPARNSGAGSPPEFQLPSNMRDAGALQPWG